MNKKTVKTCVIIFASIVTLLVLFGVGYLLNGFYGNPISKALAENTAKEYIEKNYNSMNLEIDCVDYNFKFNRYEASVKSPESVDTHFTLEIDRFGKLLNDDYEYCVTGGYNTAMRIDDEYGKKVDKILDSKSCPFKTVISYGEILVDEYNAHREDCSCFPKSELEIDKEYDIDALAEKYGKLTVDVIDDEVTAQKATEVLLKLREIMDKSKVPFYCVDMTLQYPSTENGEPLDDTEVRLFDFKYSDIVEDGLTKRVEISAKASGEEY